MGFFIDLPKEPSVYISGDAVSTQDVEKALKALKPDIAVAAAGGTVLDAGGPILMPLEEVITFIREAPSKVVANHMDALNHCPTSCSILKKALESEDVTAKVIIPEDGRTLFF